jgi:hypothetical protein
MTLLAHAAWGALFVKFLGPTYLTLRVANLTMAAIGSAALYTWMRFAEAGRTLAVFTAIAVFLSPPVFCYSCSFMTDVFGLTGAFVILAAIAACDRAPKTTWVAWAAVGALAAVFYLGRQTALLPVLAFASLLVLQRRFRALVALAGPVVAAAIIHRWWLTHVHGMPLNSTLPILDAQGARDPLKMLFRVARLAATASLFVAPAAFIWVGLSALTQGRRRFFAITCLTALASAAAVIWRPEDLLPYDGRLIYDMGIGADFSLARGDALRGPVLAIGGEKWSVFAFVASVLACVSFGLTAAAAACSRNRDITEFLASAPARARLAMIGSLIGAAVFAVLSFSFYERYLIPVYSLAIPAMAAAYHRRFGRAPSAAAWLVLILLSVCAVAGMQDYFTRNRVVWQAIAFLRERGVADRHIDGGFEFAGIVHFNSRYRDSKERVRPFAATMSGTERSDWITPININPHSETRMRLPYGVSLTSDANARTIQTFEYRSWIRRGNVWAFQRRPAATAKQ